MEINKLYQGDTTIRGEEFDFENFRRYMHYPAERDLPDNISGFLDASLLPELTHNPIAQQYRIVPVVGRDAKLKKVNLIDNIVFTGPLIYNLLLNCDLVVVHILSMQSNEFSDDWQSFISYCFHNTLIQTSSESLRKEILTELKVPESWLTQRYAPGYCGWPLYDQKSIMDLLNPEAIGVTFDNSMSLQPAHTITGIYGVRRDSTIREDMPCYTCTSISCGVHYDFIKEIK